MIGGDGLGRDYKKIGILDHMGYGNLGNTAIQEAMIANIKRRLPNALLFGFTLNPDDTRKRHNIESYPIRWSYPGRNDSEAGGPIAIGQNLTMSLKSVLKRFPLLYGFGKPIYNFLQEIAHLISSYKILRSLDLLIISGAGQLMDSWGGPWSHVYNVFKFSFLAKLSNTTLFILNEGAGPLEHPLSKFFARWSVRLAEYTSFRDAESQALLSDLGDKTKTHVYPDTAYALDLRDYIKDSLPVTSMPVVGLNPMAFCDPRIWPREDYSVYRRYLDKLASFCSWLLAQHYRLQLFTTSISVDQYAIEDLEKRLLCDWPSDRIAKMVQPASLSLKEFLIKMSGARLCYYQPIS